MYSNNYYIPKRCICQAEFGSQIKYYCVYFSYVFINYDRRRYEMKNKKRDYNICNIDITNAVSANECTGLMPSAPKNEYEKQSYFDIVDFSPKSAEKC